MAKTSLGVFLLGEYGFEHLSSLAVQEINHHFRRIYIEKTGLCNSRALFLN